MIERVLVTGGSGYLGRRCIPQLLSAGYTVIAVCRRPEAKAVVERLGARSVVGDLDDPPSLKRAFCEADADALVNIASLGFGHAPAILDACAAAGIRRAVFVSTTAIFTQLDATSKRVRIAAERSIETSSLDHTIIRPTMIYGGPDDRNIARLRTLVRRSPVVPLPGGGHRLQQPIHVEDVARALVSCLDHPESIGRAINVAGPEPLSFKTVVRSVADAEGRRVIVVPLPMAPIVAVTRLYERLSTSPRLKVEQFERLAEDKSFDGAEALRLIGHTPRAFGDGLEPSRGCRPLTQRQRAARYARTVAHLRPRQIASRLRLRSQRLIVQRAPVLSNLVMKLRVHPSGQPGWPAAFDPLDRQRFGDPMTGAELLERRFTLLNRTEGSTDTVVWERDDLPQLWRFHLHYWDWAWNLVVLGDRGLEALDQLWRDWELSQCFGRMDVWSPYVASLRLWTLCGLHRHVQERAELQAALADAVRTHAAFVRSNVEWDAGGNHLVKNLKALVGAGVFLGDDRMVGWATDRLVAAVRTQVLGDGGHYELSPTYHAQVLGDLIDVDALLSLVGKGAGRAFTLAASIRSMRSWLSEFIGPDGSTPVLNDGFALSEHQLAVLGVRPPVLAKRLVFLRDSGHVVARPAPDLHVIIDVGHPGPASLPAHSHADCLSFVVGTSAGWVIVDTGTSEYGDGARRQFERSTSAHNTVEVDGRDQTEVWGAFRAGRRARPLVLAVADDGRRITVTGQHDGYRALAGCPSHRRTIVLHHDRLDVTDELTGGGEHTVCSRLYVDGGDISTANVCCVEFDRAGARLRISSNGLSMEPGRFNIDFGPSSPLSCIYQERLGALPIEMTWRIEL